jgi:hypothetical protein
MKINNNELINIKKNCFNNKKTIFQLNNVKFRINMEEFIKLLLLFE